MIRRLLIVSYVFPPMAAGGAVRAAQFAKYLPAAGWTPTILTVRTSTGAAVDTAALDDLPRSASVLRAFAPNQLVAARGHANLARGAGRQNRSILRRLAEFIMVPDRQITWLPDALRAGRRCLAATPHDAVLAMYGPATSALVGRCLAAAFDLPLIIDFRDLWSDLPVRNHPTRFHRSLNRRLERWCVRGAARVTCVSDGMADHLARSHGVERDRVISIPNGFDPADIDLLADRRNPGGPFRICYTGSVNGLYHDLRPFFAAVRSLRDRGVATPATFEAVFVGNVPAAAADPYGIGDLVRVFPYVPHSRVFEFTATADALLLLEAASYPAGYSYSAKLFDYLLTGKPILALTVGNANSARLLRRLGIGRVADPRDSGSIERELAYLIETRGAPAVPPDIEAAPLCDFDRRRQVRKLATVLGEATRHEHRSR